ncbi:MAG TPA: 50S ribosomal protein L25 [Thermomicrobiaceae bacterium]|nr:50S ribosomal protein L25 [Thermomicrobiaceae bacterium]
MASYQKLAAEPREILGKKVRRLRREGKLPASLYGPAVDAPSSLSVSEHDFGQVYSRAGSTSLIDLGIDGSEHTVFIRRVQYDPMRRHILHINFYAPNLRQALNASVPLVFTGELASGVDGVMNHLRQDVEVRALPADLPSDVVVDISGLNENNDTIYVSDLPVPANCEIITPGDELVLKLERPQLVATTEAPEETTEAAEVSEQAEERPEASSTGE